MSIEFRNGDLLEQDDVEVIIHQCNCFRNMGKGIAVAIKNKFPEAFEADCRTKVGDPSKMGTYTSAYSEKFDKIIINMYSQFTYGLHYGVQKERHTDYEAMRKALVEFIDDYSSSHVITNEQLVLGVPFNIGCALGGGDWKVVEQILRDLFENNHRFKLVICKL